MRPGHPRPLFRRIPFSGPSRSARNCSEQALDRKQSDCCESSVAIFSKDASEVRADAVGASLVEQGHDFHIQLWDTDISTRGTRNNKGCWVL